MRSTCKLYRILLSTRPLIEYTIYGMFSAIFTCILQKHDQRKKVDNELPMFQNVNINVIDVSKRSKREISKVLPSDLEDYTVIIGQDTIIPVTTY